MICHTGYVYIIFVYLFVCFFSSLLSVVFICTRNIWFTHLNAIRFPLTLCIHSKANKSLNYAIIISNVHFDVIHCRWDGVCTESKLYIHIHFLFFHFIRVAFCLHGLPLLWLDICQILNVCAAAAYFSMSTISLRFIRIMPHNSTTFNTKIYQHISWSKTMNIDMPFSQASALMV